MFTKLMVGAAFGLLFVHSAEIFPTKARQTCLGFLSAGARIGGFVAPYIIYAGEDGNVIAPSLGSTVVILSSCVLYLLLPETVSVLMPKDVEEAVKMNSIGSQWCRCKGSKDSLKGSKSTTVTESLVECQSV